MSHVAAVAGHLPLCVVVGTRLPELRAKLLLRQLRDVDAGGGQVDDRLLLLLDRSRHQRRLVEGTRDRRDRRQPLAIDAVAPLLRLTVEPDRVPEFDADSARQDLRAVGWSLRAHQSCPPSWLASASLSLAAASSRASTFTAWSAFSASITGLTDSSNDVSLVSPFAPQAPSIRWMSL